jgi:hypothetical protein
MQMSELAELRSITIGEIFPVLSQCSRLRIEEHQLDRRALNCLLRNKCESWGDVARLSVGEIWLIPNAGRLTVERVLSASRDMAFQCEAGLLLIEGEDEFIDQSVGHLPRPPTPERDELFSFLETLAEWAVDVRGVRTIAQLFAELRSSLPTDLSSQFERIADFQIDDVFQTDSSSSLGARLIIDFLESMGSDTHLLIERHIASPSGRVPTLESLATREKITRERVRQIIKRDSERARELQQLPKYRLLVWRAQALRESLGLACSIDSRSAIEAISNAARGLDHPDGCQAEDFMLWLAGEYRDRDGFWVSGEAGHLDTVIAVARPLLQSEWLLPRQRLTSILNDAGLNGELSDADLASLTLWRSIGDQWWVRWDDAVGDKAERVLRLVLRAVNPAEMNQLLGDGLADSYVQNVLSSDGRFSRISLDLRFALADWNWEEYSSAAQEIAERIERSGGEAALADIVEELSSQFGLKENTIKAYAASPAFVLTKGRIRIRGEHEPIAVNDRVASAAGLYLREDECVVFNLQVDADVLRGSGRSIPNPLAVALGVLPGVKKDFSAPGSGHVRISWSRTTVTGAAIGSTRALAESCGAANGDSLQLLFDLRAATVLGSRVTGTSLDNLTGLTLTPGNELDELALALRVPPTEVRTALTERGDGFVASLLPVESHSSGLDEALAGLEDLLGS